MVERHATVRNSHGIHCRPSALIMRHVQPYGGVINVKGECGETDLRSVISLLGLGLSEGHSVDIQVTGPDEDRMADELVELFEREFDFRRDGDE
jgi:phosphotransferase system HPr (HPr) family protein